MENHPDKYMPVQTGEMFLSGHTRISVQLIV